MQYLFYGAAGTTGRAGAAPAAQQPRMCRRHHHAHRWLHWWGMKYHTTKEKKTSIAKKPALHPHYLEMIKEAITSLEEQPAAELRSSFLDRCLDVERKNRVMKLKVCAWKQKIEFEGYDCEALGDEQNLTRGRYLCITTSLIKIPLTRGQDPPGERILMNHERVEQDLPGGRYLCITSSGHIYVSTRPLGFNFL